ncbi:MAG: TonB-dependent receptor [Flavobacteriaceae bacterium]|nr:TonB-dependent receptor [Flavobacteriaceae bacterium]
MKNITSFLFMLFCCSTIMFAQQMMQVSGTVTDQDGNPLPGASIVLKGTMTGTETDFDGNYTLTNIPSDGTLVVSYIGFNTIEEPVNGRSSINFKLTESAESLEEVVVVGYGEMKVKDLTSSITTIKSEEITKTPAGQAMQALQGKVAGLQVVNNGAPGDSPTVRVRGVGSYPGVSDSTPLYVVDGMFYDNIDFLNPADIESISVLKDASSSAIYGVKAANGVVLIETKSGSFDKKGQITYDGYTGVQVAQNVLKMANAEQFTNMAIESGSAADVQYILNAMQRFGRSRINPNVPDVNTDWYKEILRIAPIMNHNLDFSGGGKNSSYSIGTNYFKQEGILDMKNQYERFNLRSKLDFKVNDWLTVGGSTIFSNATKYPEQNDAWFTAYYAVPVMPVIDESNTDAWPIRYASAQLLGYRDAKNPFPTMQYNANRLKIRKMLANFYAQVQLIPEKLSFKTTYSHSYETINERNVGLPYYVSNGTQRNFENVFVTKKNSTYSNQIWDNVLTYTDSFGDHHLTVMAGSEFRDFSFDYLASTGKGYPDNFINKDHPELWYLDFADPETITADDDGLRQYGLSYFSRVSYNFKDKYLLYGTIRADGSSKYQQKWGYFPTVGAGWVISQEDFMSNNKIFNYLKLRANWGQLGNDKVPASDGATTTTTITTALDDQLVTGTVSSSTFSYLEWEVLEEWDLGITARMFNNRLSIDADYFVRDNTNAVIPIIPPLDRTPVRRNLGKIRNSGLEVALDWNNSVSDNLTYSVGVNFATLKNEVKDIFGQPYIDGGSAEFRQRTMIGEPLLAFYGWETNGVYQTDAEIQADPIAVANGLVPGDFRYKDLNGDGILDANDRTVIGSFIPTYTYGANIGINYKNFEFSTSMMGQGGNKILNRKRGEIIWTPDGNMDADLAINRWHGEGTSDKYPSSSGLRRSWNQKMSTYFVEDGAFFRIQNIQIAYTISDKEFFGAKMPETKISFTADKPLTLFKYNGFNPEVADGIDRQTYPVPAVYTIGLNIKF